jgi:hypothetical protein
VWGGGGGGGGGGAGPPPPPRLQTGFVRNYALAFLAGGLVVLVYVGLRL